MSKRIRLIGALLLWCASQLTTTTADAAEIELRVLVIAIGDTSVDPGRAVAEQLLEQQGVAYAVLDSSQTDLTAAFLRNGARGRFNGIILTQSETYLPEGATGFTAEEFAILHTYEREFGVRESVLSGYPATNPSLGLDYGMAAVSWGANLDARWVAPAGGTQIFEYVNTQNSLPTEGFTFLATPRNDPAGPIAEPLLVSDYDPSYGLLFQIHYPDGREVLLSIINNATFFMHTSVLAYEFLNFATSGVFIGAHHAYLSVHNDDLFLPDEVWNPATNSNYPEETYNYRFQASEVPLLVQAQQNFRADHPIAGNLVIELAFNGSGASLSDPLTQAIIANRSQFAFINHTFEALAMDRLCDQSSSSSFWGWWGLWFGGGNTVNGCQVTDVITAYNEINRNLQAWSSYGFPDYAVGRRVLLTDSHSGLNDRRGTVDDLSDDIPFPEGFNDNLGYAATMLGVRTLAADASRVNQNRIQRVPGHSLVILPRYPTSLFYNTTNPAELVSEYNYIFYYRHVDAGLDPCTIPGAICAPRSYQEILAAEATTTLRHMLSGEPFPHYFHQSNLHVYDAEGDILQIDWLDAVVSAYERWMTLPIESPRFYQLGDLAWRVVQAREAQPIGVLDTERNIVSLSALSNATVEVTGLQGGDLRGGQRVGLVPVGLFARNYNVDRALTE